MEKYTAKLVTKRRDTAEKPSIQKKRKENEQKARMCRRSNEEKHEINTKMNMKRCATSPHRRELEGESRKK